VREEARVRPEFEPDLVDLRELVRLRVVALR
jgi:hypothetical protein